MANSVAASATSQTWAMENKCHSAILNTRRLRRLVSHGFFIKQVWNATPPNFFSSYVTIGIQNPIHVTWKAYAKNSINLYLYTIEFEYICLFQNGNTRIINWKVVFSWCQFNQFKIFTVSSWNCWILNYFLNL